MNRSTAEFLMKKLLECQGNLDETIAEIEKIEDKNEQIQLKKAVASAIGLIFSDVILKVIHQHPDLNPYKD